MTKKEERIRQVRRQKMILMAIGIGILLLAILVGAVVSGNKKKEKKEQEEARKQAQQEEKKAEKEEDILPDINVDLSELHSANAILLDAKTVKDIAELLNKALGNEEFYKVFTTNTYTTTATEEHPKGVELKSTLYKNLDTFEVTGGKILGGKTGYTESAGLCLASLADINGRKYILVTAKADGNLYTEGFHVTDAVNVYEQIGKSTK